MPPSGPPTMEDLGRRGIEVAQFVWASPTALGTCRLSDGTEFPMVKFVSNGRDVLSTRFPVRNGKSVRYFEWRRDPKEKLVFTLCDLEGRAWAQYVGGPFGNKLLSPNDSINDSRPSPSSSASPSSSPLAYLTYYWTNDDALLLHCVLAITIRRWSDQYP
ncbi:hypothetical protein DL93DRAFT_730278 [Clavulina sp. PMI_390]|nr:hypothetical protein DL93DRAFT_730278 [Clavulina sp. PMI_390]